MFIGISLRRDHSRAISNHFVGSQETIGSHLKRRNVKSELLNIKTHHLYLFTSTDEFVGRVCSNRKQFSATELSRMSFLSFLFLFFFKQRNAHYLTNKEAQAVYYTVGKHDRYFRTWGKCRFFEYSQMPGVFYHSVVHDLDFFVCCMI